MNNRKKIGLIFNYDEQWIGGTYYIINLIHAINILDNIEKPELVIFSNKKDFDYLKNEVKYPYLKFELMDENPQSLILRFGNKLTAKLIDKKIFVRRFKSEINMIFPFQENNFFKYLPEEKKVYWIPDFQDKNLPHFFQIDDLAKRNVRNNLIVTKGKKLLLSSVAVLNDLKHFYPNYSVEVKVVHFAVTHPEFADIDISILKNKFSLPNHYYFSPNQFWAHKNQLLVIKAAEELKNQGVNICIAFSGKENDNRNPGYTEMLKQYVIDKGLNDQIKFLGFLDRKEQLQLMNHSIAVIQPSLFEGWSTVIEDAMAMGKQVIASNLDVNIEQLGDKGIYFDKQETVSLANILAEFPLKSKSIEYNYSEKLTRFAKEFLSFTH